jgi:hypothetical protein
MDALYENLLTKIWVPLQTWKLHQPPYTLTQLTDEIYKYYHGEDQAAPAPTIADGAYDACVDELIMKVQSLGPDCYKKESHDHVFTNPKQAITSSEEWRIYLHAKAKDVCPIGHYIVNILFTRPEVLGFKVPRARAEADNFSDTMVIYVESQTVCDNLSQVIRASPLTAALLSGQSVPEMTRRTLDGVSYGQSPKDYNLSFGKIRSATIAKGLELYWNQGGTDPNDVTWSRTFLSHCVEIAIRAIGLDPNNAYKNDGAQPSRINLSNFYVKKLG